MKKAAIFAMAAALLLSLTACGNRDNKNQNAGSNNDKGQVDNGGVTNGSAGNQAGQNGGITNGSTSSDNGTTANDSTGSKNSTGGTGNAGSARSSIGNDVRRGLDDVGDAIGDVFDGGRAPANDTTRTTSFQQMLDSARVYDVDGSESGSIGY